MNRSIIDKERRRKLLFLHNNFILLEMTFEFERNGFVGSGVEIIDISFPVKLQLAFGIRIEF